MSLVKNAWNETYKILNDARAIGQTLEYVKFIYQGDRENIGFNNFPCIIMEDGGEPELPYTLTNRKELLFTINLILGLQITNPEKQIIGDGTRIGILDFSEDVKNVLDTYPQLNKTNPVIKNALSFSFPETISSPVVETWPYRFRQLSMTIRIIANPASR